MFVDVPAVLTIHPPHQPELSDQYARYPRTHYVAIAQWLAHAEPMPRVHVVHHGIPVGDYVCGGRKEDYVAFLGRMAPCKGADRAIEAAKRAGVRIKLAGEVQPVFHEYWETRVLPHIDGKQVEYVGEADFERKNELLSRARTCLFPIDWDEPFGLVMIEAMACGTPVLALPGGSVPEVVRDGVSGWICRDVPEMAARIDSVGVEPESCRAWVEQNFSVDRMTKRYIDLYARLTVRPRVETLAAHRRTRAGAVEGLPAS